MTADSLRFGSEPGWSSPKGFGNLATNTSPDSEKQHPEEAFATGSDSLASGALHVVQDGSPQDLEPQIAKSYDAYKTTVDELNEAATRKDRKIESASEDYYRNQLGLWLRGGIVQSMRRDLRGDNPDISMRRPSFDFGTLLLATVPNVELSAEHVQRATVVHNERLGVEVNAPRSAEKRRIVGPPSNGSRHILLRPSQIKNQSPEHLTGFRGGANEIGTLIVAENVALRATSSREQRERFMRQVESPHGIYRSPSVLEMLALSNQGLGRMITARHLDWPEPSDPRARVLSSKGQKPLFLHTTARADGSVIVTEVPDSHTAQLQVGVRTPINDNSLRSVG